MKLFEPLLAPYNMNLLAAANKSENKRDVQYGHLQDLDSFVALC